MICKPQVRAPSFVNLRERYSVVATGFCSQHVLDAFGYSGAELTVGEDGRRQHRIGGRQTGGDNQGSSDVYLEHQGGEKSADEPAEGHDDGCVELALLLFLYATARLEKHQNP